MTLEEKYATLFSLNLIYEKDEEPFIDRATALFEPDDFIELLDIALHPEFRGWLESIRETVCCTVEK